MHERARIARFFAPLAAGEAGSFVLTDDAAVLTPPPGMQMVMTTDSVIQGIHVMPDATSAQYARKLVRRNLSDLAAMGAMPWRYLLNIHTPPETTDHWFAAFAAAISDEQTQFGMVLAGGDTTSGKGPIHLTMTCIGLLEVAPLRRAGAQVGDDLYVSGTIGDAAMGLQLLQLPKSLGSFGDRLIERYHTPLPRLALGQALHGIAHAAMDISDGLLADIGQLCAASDVGACIEQEAIPRSAALQQLLQQNPVVWESIFHGGDDYELCFTASPAMRDSIAALATKLHLPLTRIGSITQAQEMVVIDAGGKALGITPTGWEY